MNRKGIGVTSGWVGSQVGIIESFTGNIKAFPGTGFSGAAGRPAPPWTLDVERWMLDVHLLPFIFTSAKAEESNDARRAFMAWCFCMVLLVLPEMSKVVILPPKAGLVPGCR